MHRLCRTVFEHLVQRFETPDPQNRWDSPFFSVLCGEELDLPGIHNSLFFNKAPKKNMSTENVSVGIYQNIKLSHTFL